MLKYGITTLLLVAAAIMAVSCGGGAGGSFGGNNVSKQITIDLGELAFDGPPAEVPVDVNGDGVIDGVVKGSVIIWIADRIEQHDSGFLAGAKLRPVPTIPDAGLPARMGEAAELPTMKEVEIVRPADEEQ